MTEGRTNQKARTRAALVQAAIKLVREGRPPSMPEAAERALISAATAYRYFSSAEDLWLEASNVVVNFGGTMAAVDKQIEAAGDDPLSRLEACIRVIGFPMFDDQVPARRLAKAALERWFSQVDIPEAERTPVREGRRKRNIATVIEPLRRKMSKKEVDRVAHALGVVVGTDAMLALTDGMNLDVPEAKRALLDASRWLLAGALAELQKRR